MFYDNNRASIIYRQFKSYVLFNSIKKSKYRPTMDTEYTSIVTQIAGEKIREAIFDYCKNIQSRALSQSGRTNDFERKTGTIEPEWRGIGVVQRFDELILDRVRCAVWQERRCCTRVTGFVEKRNIYHFVGERREASFILRHQRSSRRIETDRTALLCWPLLVAVDQRIASNRTQAVFHTHCNIVFSQLNNIARSFVRFIHATMVSAPSHSC